MRLYLLIAVGMIAGAGCATSNSNQSNPGTRARTPADANAPEMAAVAPGDANDPNAAALDELEEELAQKEVTIADPLEPVNRVMYGFNDVAYFWVVKPVASAYAAVIPKPVRFGIGNFFYNVATPARLVNCLLQGKGSAAGTEVQRFLINTTVGVLGFGDPARDRWKMEPSEEDLGQTLAVYGMGDGIYLVWPLMGPSTARDSLGMLGDQFLNPIRYVEPDALSIGISVESAVNEGSLHLGQYETLKAAAVDPYVAIRGAYIQYRKRQIQDQARPTEPNQPGPPPRTPRSGVLQSPP